MLGDCYSFFEKRYPITVPTTNVNTDAGIISSTVSAARIGTATPRTISCRDLIPKPRPSSSSHYRSNEPDAVQVDELIVQSVHGLDGHDPEDRTGGIPQLHARFEFSE